MRRHALLILGMHRSGGTALACALAKAGATLPCTPREVPGEPTPTGESVPIAALDDAILRGLGARWDSLSPLPDRWTERPAVRDLLAQAREAIRREFPDGESILVKGATMSRTAPFWREALEAEGFDVAAALMLRRPREVAASLARRDPFAPEKSLALWLSHLAEAERATRGVPRVLVGYDRLLDAPAGTLANVASATRVPLQLQGEAREQALSAIDPDLRRYGGDSAGAAPASLESGLDRVLDEGYERLLHLPPGADPRREAEALAQSAQDALTAAIPPWLARELAADRAGAERDAEALRDARRRIADLEDALVHAARDVESRQGTEADLRDRIAQLTTVGHAEGREARIDEAMHALRADVSRIAYTLSDQPAREQSLRLELSQAQRDLYDERATIGRMSEEIEIVRNAAIEQEQQLEAARAHLQSLAGELEQAREAHAARDAHEDALQREIDDLRDEASRLQSDRDLARHERDQAVRALDALKPEVETLRRDFAIATRERDAVARTAAEVGEALAALREELARRAASESALGEERARLAAEVRAAGERAGALERELGKRAADLASLTGRYDALARTVAALERRWVGRLALGRVRSA